MTKKHFFLYDFLLPLAGILAAGRFLSDSFDTGLFHSLDKIKAFGFGAWFGHSPLRATLWDFSWLAFAFFPALLWLVWVRINLEQDWVNMRRRLDRPIFTFFKGLGRWIEGDDEIKAASLAYERRLAEAGERIRALGKELDEAHAELDSLDVLP
jgi:hypothetical protein